MVVTFHIRWASMVCAVGLAMSYVADTKAADLAQALGFTPIQPGVEYTIPDKEEAAQCTIRPEKENGVAAWVVRNRQGETLRKFADTNGDNVVDLWCYYQNGLEVYRDIDSNYNHKADQYRWFHTGGTRWGIDENEDGRVDSWRSISAHEVAEQVMMALKGRDMQRFELVLLTPAELKEAGFGQARAARITESVQAARAGFSKLIAEQKSVTPTSRFIDFGSTRPARIPAGTAGSTKDIIVLDNATALVETNGKHEQIFLGTLVSVGDGWRVIGPPTIGAENQPVESGFLLAPVAPATGTAVASNAPSEEMQKLLAQLEQLYRAAETLPQEKQAANVEQRAQVLMRLAEVAPAADREQWYRQLASMISIAIQTGGYPQGFERLDTLQKKLTDAKASEDMIAAVAFHRMWAEYVVAQGQPEANQAQIQEKWLADLKAFIEKYPKSTDAGEALLQLGMNSDFIGKTEEANKWYQQLVRDFPKSDAAAKGAGALRRLNSVGKAMPLRGNDIQGGAVDLAGVPYRGKVVLIHYWATWCEPCKAHMLLLKNVYAKRGGRDFEIIGVCLDNNEAGAKQFLAENGIRWKQILEPGGLDGRLANEMGVMTLPLMVLVDQKGAVVNNNIHVQEVEGELARLIPATTGTATTQQRGTSKRR